MENKITDELKEAFLKIFDANVKRYGTAHPEKHIPESMHAAYTLGSDGKWIDIKQQLPPKDGMYLVWGSAYVDTPRQSLRCNYYKKAFRADNCNGVRTKNITHWQPLPNAPQSK